METDPVSLGKLYALLSAKLGMLSLCGAVIATLGILLWILGLKSENQEWLFLGLQLPHLAC